MISVCMATHNGEKYIKEQLESILSQLSSDDEVVISDDGSTDSTFTIIESFKDSRIKLYNFCQPSKTSHTHIYASRNFENALMKAKGDYIFLSDQDDIWMPNKVEVCLESLKKYDMIVHNMELVNEERESLGRNLYLDKISKQGLLMIGGTYYGCALAFKAQWLKKILPFPKDLVLHDFWISYIIEKLGTPYYEIRPLMQYRYREESVSHNVDNSFIFKIKYRIEIIVYIITRLIVGKLHIIWKTKGW